MSELKALFQVDLCLDRLPLGVFKYCSYDFASKNLPPEAMEVIDRMCTEIEEPRVSYMASNLRKGKRFGTNAFHRDGKETPDEVHRVVSFGGTPAIGRDGAVFTEGTVWEYSGAYFHQSRPVKEHTLRFLIRISKTKLTYRERWEGWGRKARNVG